MTKTKQATPDFRARQQYLDKLPVKDILKIRMKDLGIKNTDLQKALDYAFPNVIAMMRSGTMSLPPGKVNIVATILKIDPVFLMGKVITESLPGLWEAISEIMSDRLVTANEVSLLNTFRHQLEGHDVDLARSSEFLTAVAPVLKVIADRETALTQAALEREDD
ncbi:hypothetical protein HUU62_15340 [Rhodoferax sp. 4810]|nr:hypothetical protein [Rhodoferax jenense]